MLDPQKVPAAETQGFSWETGYVNRRKVRFFYPECGEMYEAA